MIEIIKYAIAAAVSVIVVTYSAVLMLLMCWVWCFMVACVLAAGWQFLVIIKIVCIYSEYFGGLDDAKAAHFEPVVNHSIGAGVPVTIAKV